MKRNEAKNNFKKGEVVIYKTAANGVELKVRFENETVWLDARQIALLFGTQRPAIVKHVNNVYKTQELRANSTCSILEQVAADGKIRKINLYNLDVIISVGYRVNSKKATLFRQWATKNLREHVTKGFTINPSQIKSHYGEFMQAVENMKNLLPSGGAIDSASVLELITAFADTWVSLDAYDKDKLVAKGATKKSVALTAEQLGKALADFKASLMKKGQATDLFGHERSAGNLAGIVGNVMQSFGGQNLYPTVEEKAAHLLYFTVKNHPFTDGNKRSGAYAFIWFLKKAGIFNAAKITPPALTALTLFVAESDPKNKERMIRLILQLLKK